MDDLGYSCHSLSYLAECQAIQNAITQRMAPSTYEARNGTSFAQTKAANRKMITIVEKVAHSIIAPAWRSHFSSVTPTPKKTGIRTKKPE